MNQTVSIKAKEVTTSLDSFLARHFTIDEYHRMIEVGILGENERVELIDGRIMRMSPIGSQHAAYVSFLNRKLRAVEEEFIVRIQDPIILDDETEPQPDVAIVKFRANAYADSHPRAEDVLLLVEVADTSLEEDRLIKLPRYADSGIPEVWIFNLIEDIVEVYLEPITLANGVPGYRKRTDFGIGESPSPEAFPNLRIEIPKLDNLLK